MNLANCSSTSPFFSFHFVSQTLYFHVTSVVLSLSSLITLFLNLLTFLPDLYYSQVFFSFLFALSLFGLGLYSFMPHAIYSTSLFHLLFPQPLFLHYPFVPFLTSLLVLLWPSHLHFTCHRVHFSDIFTSFTSSFSFCTPLASLLRYFTSVSCQTGLLFCSLSFTLLGIILPFCITCSFSVVFYLHICHLSFFAILRLYFLPFFSSLIFSFKV